MILYRDKHIIDYEYSGRWMENVKYLLELWEANQKNEALFLKLSTTCWYSLTLDGVEVSLNDFDKEEISATLRNCFQFFQLFLCENDTCQWIFGYMMETRPDLFFVCELSYENAEKMGRLLIKKSELQGNILAKLLNGKKHLTNIFPVQKASLKKHICECFDEATEVDKYFNEILTMSIF